MQRAAPLETIAAAVRRERERLGLSLTELARRAGVAKSTLSQLEAGTGNPSVETLWALAVELGVPFSRLVDPPADPVQVIRAGEGYIVHSEQAPFAAVLLSTCPPGARRDLHILQAEPGGTRAAHAHIAGTTEHLIVITGRWLAGPEAEPVELNVGDYIRFRGDRPHRYEALEPGSTAVLVMEHV
ncbi:transcriptional regulator, XRE family with cupin sensor [Pseudonocardia thermophila]|uniref:Transcriptional regulator, XRE family with cupin sensor n=1 Tax=Pseudonocardia thermophila TaxID=1848 RepID=A0A1M6Z358_PSETH|nr:XRE family transcriptional regulator [Pseudonocardia thermophila]SHL24961.1 transcriptional regulator, XRE family with cupin sensor [Pseudonocardia thermophila]